jgi:hypothetical protein
MVDRCQEESGLPGSGRVCGRVGAALVMRPDFSPLTLCDRCALAYFARLVSTDLDRMREAQGFSNQIDTFKTACIVFGLMSLEERSAVILATVGSVAFADAEKQFVGAVLQIAEEKSRHGR